MDSMKAVTALGALAQETRLAAFRLLVEHGPTGLTPGRMVDMLDVPAATLSFHLKELAHAGLIKARQESRFIHYSADFAAMNALVAYLTENCCLVSDACEAGCAPDRSPPTPRRRSSIAAAPGAVQPRSTRRRIA